MSSQTPNEILGRLIHLAPSQYEIRLFEHVFNGSCFGGTGSMSSTFLVSYSQKITRHYLLDDTYFLIQDDGLHLLPESKLQAIGAAVPVYPSSATSSQSRK